MYSNRLIGKIERDRGNNKEQSRLPGFMTLLRRVTAKTPQWQQHISLETGESLYSTRQLGLV
jgi:hypothetical protein